MGANAGVPAQHRSGGTGSSIKGLLMPQSDGELDDFSREDVGSTELSAISETRYQVGLGWACQG